MKTPKFISKVKRNFYKFFYIAITMFLDFNIEIETSAMRALTSHAATAPYFQISSFSPFSHTPIFIFILCNTACTLMYLYKSHLSIQLNSHVSSLFWQISWNWYMYGRKYWISFEVSFPKNVYTILPVQTMSGACSIEMQYCCWLLGWLIHFSISLFSLSDLNFSE